ncbi:dynein-related subfamily AAA family protein [Actinomadura pelletieri DSM 43383]|uniref:Dynein-related subfamily AAA family protein n=1 Tax=Actinomadura pelletieri DSM 43383 TaxID=1120940 RepID=A0A495QSX1_9ACTN|nr:ATP-binding protein [Actinomadura pelletieri]RKS76537.1 dynein-related subfamily AAA family protein [Actinomadura pelletieri DSM 43383]
MTTEKEQPTAGDWRIYRGDSRPHERVRRLPPPPPWRRFAAVDPSDGHRLGDLQRATSYRPDESVIDKVNAAILLRRPLLVTGKPGSGKSTLAYNVAYELGLGSVLNWSITSNTTLESGLYDYDAIGRLHETSLRGAGGRADTAEPPDIGRYIRLGPLGTALLPGDLPRVLLIDELDKSNIDLPNDLLNVFEEGRFTITELQRLPEEQSRIHVMTADGGPRVPVDHGEIRCANFPIVLITSNGEREFPPAFLRRCVRLVIEPPTRERLAEIVEAHLGADARAASDQLIEDFLARRSEGALATDQLLNAVYLATSGSRPPESTLAEILDTVLRQIESPGAG